jgi:hypothetical protein
MVLYSLSPSPTTYQIPLLVPLSLIFLKKIIIINNSDDGTGKIDYFVD